MNTPGIPPINGTSRALVVDSGSRNVDSASQNSPGRLYPGNADLTLLHDTTRRIAQTIPLDEILEVVVEFVTSIVPCDSCFVYVLEGDELILKASKNPHPEVVDRLKMRVGQGITGWVAKHRMPVAIANGAYKDPRFQFFNELPEDRFEGFLSVPVLTAGRLVGVINTQNRAEHRYSEREITLIATLGSLVGAEIERARLESENTFLSRKLETRTFVERAKGILQRDLKLSEDAAYRVMQRESQERRKSMKEIAEAIILSDGLRTSMAAAAPARD
jgi:uroporphyrinogen-III synthase